MELQTIIKNIGIVLLVILGGIVFGFFLSGKNLSSSSETENGVSTGEVKEIFLQIGSTGYDPGTITVSAGTTVRITADLDSVTGCFRSFIIPDLGIRKQFKQGDNVLEFTPTVKGTYKYSCSMGMARGILIVE